MNNETEIKKLLEAGKLVIGGERTLTNIKTGKAKKVFLSKNCNDEVCESIRRYVGLGNAELVELDLSSDELGAICRKTFGISVLSVSAE